MNPIQEIIGVEETQELRSNFNDMIDCGCDYDEIEDMMLDYGLKMDYIFNLIGY